MKPTERRKCFAVTVPGLESVASRELTALGFEGRPSEPGGVEFEADLPGIFSANLNLRSVGRVLVRVAEFQASAFHELERHARLIPWASLLPPGASVDVRVTCKKSRLYHS